MNLQKLSELERNPDIILLAENQSSVINPLITKTTSMHEEYSLS